MEQSARGGRSHVSVLACFPISEAREVAVAVVTALSANLGTPGGRSLLRTEAQVKWTLEVLCFGLSLPLDCATPRACVDIYAHWMTVLVSPRDSIPPPVVREPNIYVQKILRHLRTLFLPRSERSGPEYASLCQRVLNAVQLLAREGAGVSGETWEMLLHFLLCVNQSVLAAPTSASACQQLRASSAEVLFRVGLASCGRCFPPQSLWLSWRQMMTTWRFQPAVLDQWTRVVSALTSRLLRLSFHPTFPRFEVPDEDAVPIPEDMDSQLTLQTWFRFLHLLGNPADLKRPPAGVPGHPGQEDVFLTAMTTISRLVDAFLGIAVVCGGPGERMLMNTGLSSRIHFRDRLPSLGVAVSRSPFKDRVPSYVPPGASRPRSGSAPPTPVDVLSRASKSPPPPHARQKTSTEKPRTGWSQTSPSLQLPRSSSVLPAFSWAPYSSPRGPPSPQRASSVDSLLHVFGFCLFDAALPDKDSAPSERWQEGRAEACGTLCRIFSSKKTSEDVLPVYLSRFYAVLLQGLRVCADFSPAVASAVLLHSPTLFCCDLAGVNLLLPSFISALEKVLLERELPSFGAFVSPVHLRRASISVLMSLLPLPQQFGPLQLVPLQDARGDGVPTGSVRSLKPRLLGVLIGALKTETDSTNTQMLLAAVLTLVQEYALMEAAGQTDHAGHNRTRVQQSPRAAALWVEFVHLLTHHLIAQWKDDSAVCLVAVEVLGGLAGVEVSAAKREKKQAVTWICRYIEFQCSRPPPLHSRDLHSIIVVAFHCLSIWLTRHPDILEDQECLLELLEIVELGVSGSKSRQEEEVRCREQKELNPVSLRVKEAAEATLNCIMQVSGASPFLGSSLDEDALIGCSGPDDSNLKKFRYFALDASVILGFLEPEKGSAPCPSLTVLIRGQFSSHSWNFQHRLQPRQVKKRAQVCVRISCTECLTIRLHFSGQRAVSSQQSHSEGQVHGGMSHYGTGVKNEMLLDNITSVPLVQADHSFPDIWEGLTEKMKQHLNHLRRTLERQQRAEAEPRQSDATAAACTPPPPGPAPDVQTARLFLSHLGLVTPETLKDPGTGGAPAQLVSLDASVPGFYEDLRHLDSLPSRTQESAFIFYVRAGQKTAMEILQNVESRCTVSRHFLDFLSSLGQPASRGRQTVDFAAALGQSGGGAAFDGDRFVLKYDDALVDVTFVVASSSSHGRMEKHATADWPKRGEEAEPEDEKRPRAAKDRHQSKMLIVWVERLEDVGERLRVIDSFKFPGKKMGWGPASILESGGLQSSPKQLHVHKLQMDRFSEPLMLTRVAGVLETFPCCRRAGGGLRPEAVGGRSQGTIASRMNVFGTREARIRTLEADARATCCTFPPSFSKCGKNVAGGGGGVRGRVPCVILIVIMVDDVTAGFPAVVVVVVVETFPVRELSKSQPLSCGCGVHALFIHSLATGLFRIVSRGNPGAGKLGLPPPLLDGTVVGRRGLGPLVLETLINGCRRRQLCGDSAPPPHVNRKNAIGDAVLRYGSGRRSEPDFYAALFRRL
ncbi:ral GTPase-activating protein subunit beta [Syngnathoides biaculeatus]|uniref:ral GTPase-activating protein subunit beta n=1 Tax=Syngnathoides biaculeatus TaxID=300417 RepID=UPI002ADE1ECF|nr:ral GTPase-activating protein subunit beta [Syngnathoides biaculeatus]